MNRLAKVGVVLGGYVIAYGAAATSVYLSQERAKLVDPTQASGGMYAFGESILFVLVFSAIALIPTGLALYFLRPVRQFWHGLGITALAIALTAPVAVALLILGSALFPPGSHASDLWAMLEILSILRLFAVPLLAPGFVFASLFAPVPRSRRYLLAATVIEIGVVAVVVGRLVIALLASR